MNLTTKLGLAVAMIIGSFALSCGERMMGGDDGGSNAIPDAMAETGTCCTPQAPTYTKLWDGTITPSAASSPDIATGAYREIIVYEISRTLTGCGGMYATWRPDASTPYGSINDGSLSLGGRTLVHGTHAKLELSTGTGCTGSARYVVAGVL
jgi:hypothetical protein